MQSRPTVRLFGLVVVAALLVAACGEDASMEGVASLSDMTTTITAAEEAEEPTQEEALLAFTACLRENGIDVEDPTVDADGNVQLVPPGRQEGRDEPGGNEGFRQARDACADLLAGAVLGFGGGVDRTELEDDLVEFAECMRDNGYDMPDPDFSAFGPGAGGGGGPFAGVDPEDPTFQTASEACTDILAGFGPRPGGGRPGGGGGNG